MDYKGKIWHCYEECLSISHVLCRQSNVMEFSNNIDDVINCDKTEVFSVVKFTINLCVNFG